MLLVLCVMCVCLYFIWKRGDSKDEPPVFSGALPIIGHLHLVYGDTSRFMKIIQIFSMESIRKGGVLKFILGPYTCYVITDPVDCVTALNACEEKSILYTFAKRAFGGGLVTSSGQTWKTHRKLLNPMFNQQLLNGFISTLNEHARRLMNKFNELGNEPFEYEHHLLVWSLESMCKTVMGVDIDDVTNENDKFVHAIDGIFKLFVRRLDRLWLLNDYTYSWSSLKKEEDSFLRTINNKSKQVLLKRKGILYSSTKNQVNFPSDNFRPFIDHMLLMSEKEALTDKEVLDEVKTLIAAAYDTTGTTMCFILMMLGAHKEVQNRAYEELINIYENSDRDVDKYDLPKMVYLEAVIKETLRLYPVVPVYAKRAPTDIKLSKYTLPSGCEVVVSALGLGRHPLWGADADQFKPERWLDPESLPENHNAFAAFGLGRRSCIGRNYAMMTMKITLAHIMRRCKITSYNNNPTLKWELISKPTTPLLISLESRK